MAILQAVFTHADTFKARGVPPIVGSFVRLQVSAHRVLTITGRVCDLVLRGHRGAILPAPRTARRARNIGSHRRMRLQAVLALLALGRHSLGVGFVGLCARTRSDGRDGDHAPSRRRDSTARVH